MWEFRIDAESPPVSLSEFDDTQGLAAGPDGVGSYGLGWGCPRNRVRINGMRYRDYFCFCLPTRLRKREMRRRDAVEWERITA